eukprot:Rmarinus@m.3577
MAGGMVVAAVDAIFKSDPKIDELAFFPVLPDGFPSDAYHCDGHIFHYEHKLALTYRIAKELIQEARDIYERLRGNCNAVEELQSCSRAILLVNANAYYALNIRKRLVLARKLSPLEELRFVSLLLTKHPKSEEAWYHRRWVLQQLGFPDMSNPTLPTQEIMQEEIRICERVAALYPRNYYAWLHRQWLVSHMDAKTAALEAEAVADWGLRHLGDGSAWHHRVHVARRRRQVCDCNNSNGDSDLDRQCALCLEILRDELRASSRTLVRSPNHEAAWGHRRAVLALWVGGDRVDGTTTSAAFDVCRLVRLELALVSAFLSPPSHLSTATTKPATTATTTKPSTIATTKPTDPPSEGRAAMEAGLWEALDAWRASVVPGVGIVSEWGELERTAAEGMRLLACQHVVWVLQLSHRYSQASLVPRDDGLAATVNTSSGEAKPHSVCLHIGVFGSLEASEGFLTDLWQEWARVCAGSHLAVSVLRTVAGLPCCQAQNKCVVFTLDRRLREQLSATDCPPGSQ